MAKISKRSKQREELFRILASVTSHPTADWLYNELRKVIPNVSLGTVYRNLNLLTEAKIIQKIEVGTPTDHFDANAENHYHFVCEKCERVFDIDMDVLDDLNKKVEERCKHIITGHSLLFHGICRECLDKQYNLK